MPTPPVPSPFLRSGAGSVAADPEAQDVTAKDEHDPRDNFRHIVCVLCYPAFDRSREAPHDAVCICGKQLRKGQMPKPSNAAQCILCNEMWDHHLATVHPDERSGRR